MPPALSLTPKILEDFLAQVQESARKDNMAMDSAIRKMMDDHTGSGSVGASTANSSAVTVDSYITAEEDWNLIDKHDGSDGSDSEGGGVIVNANRIPAVKQAKVDNETQDEKPPGYNTTTESSSTGAAKKPEPHLDSKSERPPLYPAQFVYAAAAADRLEIIISDVLTMPEKFTMLRDRCEATEQFLLKHNMHPISNSGPVIAACAGDMAKVLEDLKSRQQWVSESQKWPTERTLRMFKCALRRADSRLRCLREEITIALRMNDRPTQVAEVERLRGEIVKAHKGLLPPLLPPPQPFYVPPVPGPSGPVPDPASGAAPVQHDTSSPTSGYTVFPSAHKLEIYREELEREAEIARLKYELAEIRIVRLQSLCIGKGKEPVRGDVGDDSSASLAGQARSWPEGSLHVSDHVEWLSHSKHMEAFRAVMCKQRDERKGDWMNRALRAEAALEDQKALNRVLAEKMGCTF